MSAESPKRTPRLPTIVPPEPVSDRSIIESVTGFINEVTLTSVPPIEQKEQIQWVRFETTADISNPSFGEDYDLETGVPPPLILILGYKTGIQIWAIPANGEATEVLSWRHGVVRSLKVLPTPISSYVAVNANEPTEDLYALKRPLMAISESSQVSSAGPQFCTMNIISLCDGDTIKSIKFKTTILEIAANHQSIVVTFAERIAVFDARTLEDRLTITTCYPSPGLSPNPIAIGPRWLAYAERKLIPSKRSAGGCDCDGVSSYTATVLNAAKTLSKGLRELGEQVAAGLTGTGSSAHTVSAVNSASTGNEQQLHPGIVTIFDIKDSIKDTSPTGTPMTVSGNDPIIAHFVAHTDVVAGMTFDASGLLLMTADKRGHDFHVFRINPHPGGPTSASVHHLYILHRGDTTAKVQDMIFSLDSRWAAVTTARGTTHVFPVSPYGGPATYRTHGSSEVVNRLSRFHRSAGLSADGRSSSPICPVFHGENGSVSADPYHNTRLPPFPRPYIVMPLKQLRQPLTLLPANNPTAQTAASSSARQRQSSVSDDSGNVLRVCATFARPRDWLLQSLNTARDMPALRNPRNAVDSLFVMAGHGSMIQYDLDPKYISSIPASKQNDDSPIELYVEAKAQWNLLRKDNSIEIQPPLQLDNWLLKNRLELKDNTLDSDTSDNDERWLSQVEIVTSSGPHRRLWMGPQFIFKTYNTPSGSTLQHIDSEAVEIGVNCPANRPARSNPMQTPSMALGRGVVPVLIESGSASSYEQSPRFMNQYQEFMSTEDLAIMPAETQLREDLADAMRESPRDSGLSTNQTSSSSSCATTSARSSVSIAKVVNPLGTVTTITESPRESTAAADEFTEEYSSGAYIHENCDESMFRPYVAVISGSIDGETSTPQEKPEPIGQKLIVPVIDGSKLEQQNREKSRQAEMERQRAENIAAFDRMSLSDRKEKKNIVLDVEPKDTTKKSNGKPNAKDDEKVVAKETSTKAAEKLPDKNTDKKNDNNVAKNSDDTETVTVKLKKKGNKAPTKPPPEPLVEPEEVQKKTERTAKKESDIVLPQDDLEFSMVPYEKESSDCEKVEEFVVPKAKSKKKSLVESSSSKESSVEKELTLPPPAEGTKSKKKKKKQDTQQQIATSSSDDAKGSSASEVVTKRSVAVVDNSDDNSYLLDSIEKVDGAQCAEIQTSLLKNSVSATVSMRKSSLQEKTDDSDAIETKAATRGKKKKWSKESIEVEALALNSPNAITDESTEFTYPDPSESVLDLDNLSFKSTIDDQISMVPLESLQHDTEWGKERNNDYDKLSDDAETGSGAQYSDCKSFQLIIDEPELYLRASDTNSSDETEDSSQSKSTKSSEKTVDEDDEELQPLICSTTSDTAVDLSKSDALPNEVNQSDSTTPPPQSSQPQPQKQSNPNNNNKKKFKKKRR